MEFPVERQQLKCKARAHAWSLFARVPIKVRRRLLFARHHRKWLHLRHPTTFNEKVNWRIIFDRRDEIAWTCDKLQMKEHAALRCPSILIPKTLWSGVDLEELRGLRFPARWVLKPNHGSQNVFLGHGTPNIAQFAAASRSWMRDHLGSDRGEWAYTQARPLYILEEWIGDGDEAPSDYKFFVFDGKVRMIQVDTDRFSSHKIALFSPDWDRLQATKSLHGESTAVPRPDRLDLMIKAAEAIADGYDFMRIDLFSNSNGVYFGETTPYPGSGLSPFSPPEYDKILGSYWTLPSLPPVDPSET